MLFKYWILLVSFSELIISFKKIKIVDKGIEDDFGTIPPYKQGLNITLKCQTSEDMDKCKWYFKFKDYCIFEWSYYHNTSTKNCLNYLKDRIEFVGNDRKCFIRLINISHNDQGKWICEVQSFLNSSFNFEASNDTGTVSLKVDPPKREGNHTAEI